MPLTDFRSPRLFVDAPLSAGARIALERGQANYLGNVLRLGAGGAILVFNGRDGEWRAAIGGGKRPDRLEVVAQTRPQDSLPDLAYVFAPLKHARLDYMVVNDARDGTFFARVILRMENELGKKIIEIDARPSDSIVLALQQQRPIYVAQKVFDGVEDMSEILRQQEQAEEGGASGDDSP